LNDHIIELGDARIAFSAGPRNSIYVLNSEGNLLRLFLTADGVYLTAK
jgi:hypothetical protein